TELLDEPLAPCRAETWDVVEHALRHPLAAQLSMEADREAVRLVTKALQQVQRLALTRDRDRIALTGHVDLLEALGERGNRDLVLEAELVHDALCHSELTLAAVDEQQLRRVRKPAGPTHRRTVALGEVCSQPAREHFLHRGEVVVPRDALHLE